MLQGTFDSIEDLLQVADLYFPGEGCSTQYFFPTVVAANLPWIAATSSDVKGVVGQEWSSLMFQPGDLQGLTTRLRSWLQDPSSLELETAKAKSYFIEHQSAEGSLERWSSLFRGLL